MNGETDGIALLTQYNGHGIFIAMEELGYITMSISFLFSLFQKSHEKICTYIYRSYLRLQRLHVL